MYGVPITLQLISTTCRPQEAVTENCRQMHMMHCSMMQHVLWLAMAAAPRDMQA